MPMPRIARISVGVAAGIVAWFVVATVGDWLLRLAIAGYAEVEASMHFTLPMQVGRLCVGAASSIAAGATCAWLVPRTRRAVTALAIVLVLLFLPVHYRLWSQFPAWYHATFLILLAPLVFLGARLSRRA
jgi:hypothetical protein